MKTSKLHEWLLATKDPQIQLSPGARIYPLLPADCGRTILSVGHLAYQIQTAAKRHAERGHAHRVMINKDAEVIADGMPADFLELAGWEELTWDGFNGTDTWKDAR